MTRKGLIVVEQMPLLLITPTSQELLFKAIFVLSGPLTVPAPSRRGRNKGYWHFCAS